jgi:hypothetical protein
MNGLDTGWGPIPVHQWKRCHETDGVHDICLTCKRGQDCPFDFVVLYSTIPLAKLSDNILAQLKVKPSATSFMMDTHSTEKCVGLFFLNNRQSIMATYTI